jgi:hypothetical protein
MLSIVTASAWGLMLAMMMTSVFVPPVLGRVSMPRSAMLIVPSGSLTSGTGGGTSVSENGVFQKKRNLPHDGVRHDERATALSS